MRISIAVVAMTLGVVGCGGNAFSSNGGGGPSGGSHTGGAVGTGGGIVGTGGSDSCGLVDCAYPVCPDGVPVEVPAGQCCPVCACDVVACDYPTCPPGVGVVTPPGECCPVCDTNVAPSCADVACLPAPTDCPTGYKPGRAPGACCDGCVPTGEVIVPPNCTNVLCATPDICPLGYHADWYLSQCCQECVPDPGYCMADSDCLMAINPSQCCTCSQSISVRTYDADLCWSADADPRAVPTSCYPPSGCGATCGVCAPPGLSMCVDRHCTEVRPL